MIAFRVFPRIEFAGFLLMVSAFGLAACAGDSGAESGGDAYEVVDSAGVEIVRNRVAASGLSMLARTEGLRIGVREGPPELELFNVRDVVVSSDGEIFAASASDNQIRVFGPDGQWRRSFGRQGGGPGEFQFLAWLGVHGDTVLAIDGRDYRVTTFTTDGRVLDTWLARKGTSWIMPQARTPNGWLVTVDDFRARVPYDIGQPGTDTVRIALVQSVPGAIDSLTEGTPPWNAIPTTVKYPAWTTHGIGRPGLVFGRNALWDSRQHHAFDDQGRTYVARGSSYVIDVFDATGALLRRITRSYEPVPITDALVDRYRSAVFAHYDTANTVGEAGLDLVDAAHQHIALPQPDHLPVLGRIAVSAEGATWVERPDLVDDPLLIEWSRAGTQPARWDTFDPDGRFVGTVEMPTRSTVHAVGTDWVIVTERDELDVQYIVKYTIAS